jgi:hypothetical protein
MGDPRVNDDIVVGSVVADSNAAEISAAVTMDTSLMPFDPAMRVFRGVKRGIQAALGSNTWSSVQSALPDPGIGSDMEQFMAGVIIGIGDTIKDVATQNIRLFIQGSRLVIDFYELVYNVDVWFELAKVWGDEPGADLSGFREFLQNNYPALYAALTSVSKLQKALNSLADALFTKVVSPPWSAAAYAIADWVVTLSKAIGRLPRTGSYQSRSQQGKASRSRPDYRQGGQQRSDPDSISCMRTFRNPAGCSGRRAGGADWCSAGT